jgi:aspartate-semialdehyde dehydrogenase
MIGCDFQYRDKIPVAILGATGSVGQKFVQLLSHHPWFQIRALAASEKSAGLPYGEAAKWQMPEPLSPEIANMIVRKCEPAFPCSIVFSGLDASVAGEIETAFAKEGCLVISNCRNHRMDADVPLLIPEVNSEHLGILKHQTFPSGKIITNPNCTVTGLAIALKPLDDHFGLESVSVVTLQAISGAGFHGRKNMNIDDNIIPFIKGEEEKIESEIKKILGSFDGRTIQFRSFNISAQCNRVPVSDGHFQCVSVKLSKSVSEDEIIKVWKEFRGEVQRLKLPTAPEYPIQYFNEETFPQPKIHRDLDKGMAVSVGRLRKCPLFDYKFVLLVHNTIRGAAGCAILNAELMTKSGMVYW